MTDDRYRLSAVGYRLSAVGWLYSRKQGGACGARVLWSERFPTRRSRHRHLERRYVPLWEADRNRSHDALSREISHRNAARTIRGGDFSTPLRFGRNDGGRGPAFFKSAPEGRHYNPRPERPSNLRTLRPIGPVNLKNLPLLNLKNLRDEVPSTLTPAGRVQFPYFMHNFFRHS